MPLLTTLPPNTCICGELDCQITYGYCHCGCGGKTTIPNKSNKRFGYVAGVPRQWIRFHEFRLLNQRKPEEKSRNSPVPILYRARYIGVAETGNFPNQWRAVIVKSGKRENLGVFPFEIDAGRAYDKAAIDYYGNSAILNFPEDYPEFMEAQQIRINKEKEIAWRIIHTDATIISIGKEEGCSFSKINVMYKKYTTKEERLQAKHRKTAKLNLGRKNPNGGKWFRTHAPWNKGIKISMEERIARSAHLQGVTVENWAGFSRSIQAMITSSIEYRTWRKSVYERDNWTCQHCKKRGGCLHAHHIKLKSKYPELMFDVSNGLTLCESCHHKVHAKKPKEKNLELRQPL